VRRVGQSPGLDELTQPSRASVVTALPPKTTAKTFAPLGADKSEHLWMQIVDVGQLLHPLRAIKSAQLEYPQTEILTGSFNLRALLSDVT